MRRTLRSEAVALLVSEDCTCTVLITLLQQVVLDGVVSDVRVGFHAHLLQYPGAVGADGLHAQEQLGCDFRNTLTFGELAEDLKLAFRQHAVPRLAGRTLHAADEHLRQLRTHIAPAAHRSSYRPAELAIVSGFTDEATGPGAQHVEAVLVLGVGA